MTKLNVFCLTDHLEQDDTHRPNWGKSRAWTGILAPGLSKQNILDALSKRHCYSTLDRNCHMMLRLNDAYSGDIITEPIQEIEVRVRVGDPDVGDSIKTIELFEDGKVVDTDIPDKQDCCWNSSRTPAPGKHYYFVKVTQADGNMLWSAPIWVTVGEQ